MKRIFVSFVIIRIKKIGFSTVWKGLISEISVQNLHFLIFNFHQKSSCIIICMETGRNRETGQGNWATDRRATAVAGQSVGSEISNMVDITYKSAGTSRPAMAIARQSVAQLPNE